MSGSTRSLTASDFVKYQELDDFRSKDLLIQIPPSDTHAAMPEMFEVFCIES
jgi:hypothetical protein